jgi:hypothetical protein
MRIICYFGILAIAKMAKYEDTNYEVTNTTRIIQKFALPECVCQPDITVRCSLNLLREKTVGLTGTDLWI